MLHKDFLVAKTDGRKNKVNSCCSRCICCFFFFFLLSVYFLSLPTVSQLEGCTGCSSLSFCKLHICECWITRHREREGREIKNKREAAVQEASERGRASFSLQRVHCSVVIVILHHGHLHHLAPSTGSCCCCHLLLALAFLQRVHRSPVLQLPRNIYIMYKKEKYFFLLHLSIVNYCLSLALNFLACVIRSILSNKQKKLFSVLSGGKIISFSLCRMFRIFLDEERRQFVSLTKAGGVI